MVADAIDPGCTVQYSWEADGADAFEVIEYWPPGTDTAEVARVSVTLAKSWGSTKDDWPYRFHLALKTLAGSVVCCKAGVMPQSFIHIVAP